MKRVLLVALFALPLAACAASHQYFEPAERISGQTLKGDKLAIYPLSVAGGALGEAKLWSSGAYEAEGGGAFVHVGIELHNTSAVPLELRAGETKLDVLSDPDGPFKGLRPASDAKSVVAPGAIGEINFQFVLPVGVSPGDVTALRFYWQVHAGDQTYAQRTPFVEEVDPTYYGASAGYYGYGCWPYGPYDCLYAYPYGYPYAGPVLAPRYVPLENRTAVRPRH
jgi:hypothetical protein